MLFRHPLVRSAAYEAAGVAAPSGRAPGTRGSDRSGRRAGSAGMASRARLTRVPTRKSRRNSSTRRRVHGRGRCSRGRGAARTIREPHARSEPAQRTPPRRGRCAPRVRYLRPRRRTAGGRRRWVARRHGSRAVGPAARPARGVGEVTFVRRLRSPSGRHSVSSRSPRIWPGSRTSKRWPRRTWSGDPDFRERRANDRARGEQMAAAARSNSAGLAAGRARDSLRRRVGPRRCRRCGARCDRAEPGLAAGMSPYWLGFLSAAAVLLWDIDSLRTFGFEEVARTREEGALTLLPLALNNIAHVLVLEGDLDGAATALGEAKQILAATGSALFIFTSAAPILAALRGDDGAGALIDEQIATTTRNGPAGRPFERAVGERHVQQRREAIRQGIGLRLPGTSRHMGMGCARLPTRNHRGRGACRAARRLPRRRARSSRSPPKRAAPTGRSASSVDALRSSPKVRRRKASTAKRSIDSVERRSAPTSPARTCSTANGCGARVGASTLANSSAAAHEMFNAIGMHAFAERTRNELLATGETVRKRAVDSFDELTPQEALVRAPCCRRKHEPRDRCPTVHQSAYCRVALGQGVHETAGGFAPGASRRLSAVVIRRHPKRSSARTGTRSERRGKSMLRAAARRGCLSCGAGAGSRRRSGPRRRRAR